MIPDPGDGWYTVLTLVYPDGHRYRVLVPTTWLLGQDWR